MAQNITLLGASYSAVPAVTLPKTGGGTATFTDVTDTTATAEDVASGKVFFDADGVQTTGTASGGGGSTTLKMGVIRPDAELIQTYTYDKYIVQDEGVTFPAYTTSQTTLIASSNLTPTVAVDLDTYKYYILERMLAIPTYNVSTTGKGRVEYTFDVAAFEVFEIPGNTIHAIIDPTKLYAGRTQSVYATGSGYRVIYYSGATTLTSYNSNSYGPNQAVQTPTLSSSALTLKTPTIQVRGHSTYYTSTYMNATTDVRFQYIFEVYRAPKGNLNLDGWGLWQQADHIIDCIDGGGTLT